MKLFFKEFYLFCFGAVAYGLIEIMFRGNTHWTMLIVGGLCFVLIGAVNEVFPYEIALTSQMLISAVIITALEFVSGTVINDWFRLGVWNYSDMPYNVNGQICLVFFCAWFFLSLVGIVLDDYMRYKLFGEERPHYKLL
ncbi:putative ABC transporter permease [Acetanaerobacterium elongatum]|uniref:Putative ABC-transporter type IV n=1 Tax=Acetanaerobacterium elongatum TaxID=258515 RepID=A0A1H0A3V9_9FIRM|nr:hypothetical protein [Acetanaerobacterium elongatum]SDN28107.1 Putative ABC-transporter type IV [Acetanaerobacterium elongatum]